MSDELRIKDYGRGFFPEEWNEKLDTNQMREKYEVIGFAAPFVVVRRKEDGQKGIMEFTHFPRWYFNFVEM